MVEVLETADRVKTVAVLIDAIVFDFGGSGVGVRVGVVAVLVTAKSVAIEIEGGTANDREGARCCHRARVLNGGSDAQGRRLNGHPESDRVALDPVISGVPDQAVAGPRWAGSQSRAAAGDRRGVPGPPQDVLIGEGDVAGGVRLHVLQVEVDRDVGAHGWIGDDMARGACR